MSLRSSNLLIIYKMQARINTVYSTKNGLILQYACENMLNKFEVSI